MYFVYILRCDDRSLYTGITNDLKRRVEEHKKGIGSRYTRSKKSVRLVYSEQARDRSAALKKEAGIKRLSRQKKLELIQMKNTAPLV